MKRNRVVVINCSIADSDDYNHMYDSALHNSLQPLWDWAAENGVSMFFEKDYADQLETYSLKIRVTAVFDQQEDLAMFKLAFNNYPLTKFQMGADMVPTFV